MRFEHTEEQRDFARSLDQLLASGRTVAAARAWAEGNHAPGLALWRRLADLGLLSLATDATPAELVIAFEALGRHAVPGPWVESAAYLPLALGREVSGVATVALPPHVPFALDADVADEVYVGTTSASSESELVVSVDPTRRLFRLGGLETGASAPSSTTAEDDSARAPSSTTAEDDSASAPSSTTEHPAAFDLAVLATSAQLLGAGEHLLAASVAYVQQRRQFGRPIGSYQAIKHHLADVRIALDFARPLVDGAALATDADRSRDVSAAKVAAGDAAYLASRVALQVHGAIGYTAELDLSLWILKVRALVTAWGTPAFHRSRVLAALLAAEAS